MWSKGLLRVVAYLPIFFSVFINGHWLFVRTCNEAVRGDMGLDSLQGGRDKAKLKWWHKLACMEGDRYHTSCLGRFGILKSRRGCQRKPWSRVVNDSFHH